MAPAQLLSIRTTPQKAYDAAIAANVYTESSYDRNNHYEYFAGQANRWFKCNPTNLSNQIGDMTDREALEAYDPTSSQLLSGLFDPLEPWSPPRGLD
jgi:hypothetical protein